MLTIIYQNGKLFMESTERVSMKLCFCNKKIQGIYENYTSLKVKYGQEFADGLSRLNQFLESIEGIDELYDPVGRKYKFHKLKADRNNQWSFVVIRSSRFRLIVYLLDKERHVITDIFKEKCEYIKIKEIGDYHNG